jgi:hypothetical protein
MFGHNFGTMGPRIAHGGHMQSPMNQHAELVEKMMRQLQQDLGSMRQLFGTKNKRSKRVVD